MRESKVTVKIPRPLYRKIQLVIDHSGFSSPTDFIVFVLRDLVGEAEKKGGASVTADEPASAAAGGATSSARRAGTKDGAHGISGGHAGEHGAEIGAEEFDANDLEAVKQKLKNLGYL
jgi:Arc/MetJ-type ribon-helix-helix transcriptional regulator